MPGLSSPAAVLRLQQRAGNAAVARLIQRDAITGEPSNADPDKKNTGTVGALPEGRDALGSLDADERATNVKLFPATPMKAKGSEAAPLVRPDTKFPGMEALIERRRPAQTITRASPTSTVPSSPTPSSC